MVSLRLGQLSFPEKSPRSFPNLHLKVELHRKYKIRNTLYSQQKLTANAQADNICSSDAKSP